MLISLVVLVLRWFPGLVQSAGACHSIPTWAWVSDSRNVALLNMSQPDLQSPSSLEVQLPLHSLTIAGGYVGYGLLTSDANIVRLPYNVSRQGHVPGSFPVAC